MNRRKVLRVSAATIGVAALAPHAFGAAMSLAAMARETWLYADSLIEDANVRRRIVAKGPANAFVHHRNLADTRTKRVTSPNDDTIWSHAMLDLRAGPVELSLPAAGARYFSLQLIDIYTSNLAVLGIRTNCGGGGSSVVADPTGEALPRATRAGGTGWIGDCVKDGQTSCHRSSRQECAVERFSWWRRSVVQLGKQVVNG